ncbi:HD domain-containing protein [Candidatus Uhrbacteria bacterium]|jgi:hypothetical protein|nr:HD domain-containing protein [Candidatus Uhrbacteria bacterium]
MDYPILRMTYEELVQELLMGASRTVRRRAERFVSKYREPMRMLQESGYMQFLKLQTQHGYKPIMSARNRQDIPVIPYDKIPREYSRYFHVILVAALNTVMAAVIGLSAHNTRRLVVAGFCHDLGHSKFGHTGERLLVQLYPKHKKYKKHEERTILILQEPEMQKLLEAFGLTWRNVESVVDERGHVGAIQRFTDSAAWTTLDVHMSEFFGESTSDDAFSDLRFIIGKFRGMSRGAFIVSDIDGIQKVVDRRAFLFRDWFRSHLAEQTQWGMIAAMGMIFKKGWIDPDALYSDGIHEQDLVHTLRQRAHLTSGFEAQWIYDLLALPIYLELPKERWHVESFADGGMEAWIVKNVDPQMLPYIIRVPKQNGRRLIKEFSVLIEGGSGELVVVTTHPGILEVAKDDDLSFVMVPI